MSTTSPDPIASELADTGYVVCRRLMNEISGSPDTPAGPKIRLLAAQITTDLHKAGRLRTPPEG
jgi:hypothetical protein